MWATWNLNCLSTRLKIVEKAKICWNANICLHHFFRKKNSAINSRILLFIFFLVLNFWNHTIEKTEKEKAANFEKIAIKTCKYKKIILVSSEFAKSHVVFDFISEFSCSSDCEKWIYLVFSGGCSLIWFKIYPGKYGDSKGLSVHRTFP
jgi:hypothetical protein